MTHRQDIDGLRAVSVLAVILYHAGVPGFGGGYVGVDVFFVISGYLITEVLTATDAHIPRPGLADFYLRRLRRLFPAFFVVCLSSGCVALALLLPWDLPAFGKYLTAAGLLLSNLPGWRSGANYFDSRTDYIALTHLWSIGIEEQFYIAYPIVLLLLVRWWPRRRLQWLIELGVGSFSICVWGSAHRPLANFFLPPSRAWEFLAGAAAASAPAALTRHPRLNDLLGCAALSLLAAIIFGYTRLLRYPGWFTLLPCLAAVLLLASAQLRSTLASRLLSIRPLAFTGLISYSLYLWHLPILMFATYYFLEALSPWAVGALLGVIYLVGAASWRWVESPFRHGGLLPNNRNFLVGCLLANTVLLSLGIWMWNSNGLPGRFQTALAIPDNAWMRMAVHDSLCFNPSPSSVASGSLCSYGPQDAGTPRALVWGDSHAMALLPAYADIANSRHIRIFYAVKSACRPLLGVSNALDDVQHRIDCARFNDAVAQAVDVLKPQWVILNAHWSDDQIRLVAAADTKKTPARIESGIAQVADRIAGSGARLCAVLDVASFKYSLPHALSLARMRGLSPAFLTITEAQARQEFALAETDFRSLARARRLVLVDPKDVLCRSGNCAYQADGILLYADQHHLSTLGAHLVEGEIDQCFREPPSGIAAD